MSAPIAGVWTPWAEVLCRICHDAMGPEVTAKREIKWPGNPDPTAAPDRREWREGDGQGICTACGAAVWVHEDIAQLTRLRAIAGGELQQTGGMCSALAFSREDKGTVVVTNMDDVLSVAIFPPGGWEEGEEALRYYVLPLAMPDEAAAAAIQLARTEPLEGANV